MYASYSSVYLNIVHIIPKTPHNNKRRGKAGAFGGTSCEGRSHAREFSNLGEPRLIHHAHGFLNLGKCLVGDFVRALVAFVENILDVVKVVLVLGTAFANGREVFVDRLGDILLQRARAASANYSSAISSWLQAGAARPWRWQGKRRGDSQDRT